MNSRPTLLGTTLAALALALALAGGLASAGEEATVKADLARYFPIRAALAGDRVEGVKEHADALARSADGALAKAAAELSAAADIAGARRAFGEVTRALLVDVERAAKAGADVGAVYVFECSMAKPYGRWMQAEPELGNPYYGAQMLTCGKQVAALGTAGKTK